jgi:hypothetical protein
LLICAAARLAGFDFLLPGIACKWKLIVTPVYYYTETTSKIGFQLRRLASASNACLHRVSLLKLTLLRQR